MVEHISPTMKKADAEMERLRDILSREDAQQLEAFISHELYAAIDPVTTLLDELGEVQLEVAQQEFGREQPNGGPGDPRHGVHERRAG
ncbi:hypothetical protein F0U61_00465 [Archangium violaceum]|uniref:hypothetical protein n=1 Tax=Archangium violaceum TaxID=83451 RepID=UPI002B28C257|nr:hypothetical protein F0U61_00465 [Archangium violaceum]